MIIGRGSIKAHSGRKWPDNFGKIFLTKTDENGHEKFQEYMCVPDVPLESCIIYFFIFHSHFFSVGSLVRDFLVNGLDAKTYAKNVLVNSSEYNPFNLFLLEKR